MCPVESSSQPGAALARTRAKTSSDNRPANVLASVYGNIPIGADGTVLMADSADPMGARFGTPPALSAPAFQRKEVTGSTGSNYQTSAAAMAEIGALDIAGALTVAAGSFVRMLLTGYLRLTANTKCFIAPAIDGAIPVGSALPFQNMDVGATQDFPCVCSFVTSALTAGPHTFGWWWSVLSGGTTATLFTTAGNAVVASLEEIRAP